MTKGHRPDIGAFVSFLKLHDCFQWTDVLLKNGYSLDNFDRLCAADLKKLRITNKRACQQLLGLAQLVKDGTMGSAATLTSTSDTSPSHSTHHTPRRDDPMDPEFTATMPTSNERIRQATLYLDHHHIDRPWPRPGSELARSLALSNCVPHSGSNTLYSVTDLPETPDHRLRDDPHASIVGRASPHRRSRPASPEAPRPEWKPVNNRASVAPTAPPVPPRRRPQTAHVQRHSVHSHGKSAKFCGVCEEHVINASISSQGQWQYLTVRTIVIGIDETEKVNVWTPFDPMECLALEHALRHNKRRVKVGKHQADFKDMLWGPHKIRRVASSAVPFPTLKKSELVAPPPDDDTAEAEKALAAELDESFQKLHLHEEERARFYLWHAQARALDEVLAEIADMMDQHFAKQRLDLEAEEAAARQQIFDENFELALDDLWEQAETSVQDVQLTDVRRSSENVVFQQQDVISKMEELGRDRVIVAERAARANLERLVARFNEQVRALHKQSQAEMVANTTLRCRVCRRMQCKFFNQPWHNHWRHTGRVSTEPWRPRSASPRRTATQGHDEEKVRDRRPRERRMPPEPPAVQQGFGKVSELIGRAKELEFEEFLKDERRHAVDRKALSPEKHPHPVRSRSPVQSIKHQPAAPATARGPQGRSRRSSTSSAKMVRAATAAAAAAEDAAV